MPDKYLLNPEKNFGNSTKLIASLKSNYNIQDVSRKEENSSVSILEDAKLLASCAYEANTNWGKEASVLYIVLKKSHHH